MGHELKEQIPEAENLLLLEPEELAQVLLPILKKREQAGDQLNGYNFANDFRQMQEIYPRQYVPRVTKAIMEAWSWLIAHGLLVPHPEHHQGSVVFLTRAAWRLETTEDFENFRKANLLSPALLHPIIAEKAWSTFIRGKHDTAVFEAFKEVEIAVRAAGGYGPRMIGTDLMRAAFHPENGPLTDKSLPTSEREALSFLFVGAIGSYKNPSSHRTVVIADAAEAGEMLSLASHLLRIVDARAAMRQQNAQPNANSDVPTVTVPSVPTVTVPSGTIS